jgi:hypothetical protein
MADALGMYLQALFSIILALIVCIFLAFGLGWWCGESFDLPSITLSWSDP